MVTPVAGASFEEYMKTNYRPDREWVDGELKERNVVSHQHGRLQVLLGGWFLIHEDEWGVKAVLEQRSQVSPKTVRIPDLVLLSPGHHPDMLVDPPLLVVEILSPGDTYADTINRATDYFKWGAPVMWIIDPSSRTGMQCVGNTWTAAETLVAPGTPIHVSLTKLFHDLDK